MQCYAEENVKLKELKRAQVADSWGKSILQYLVYGLLPDDAIQAVESHKYVLNDGVLYYVQSHGLPKPKVEEKLYIPKSMRHQILQVFHEPNRWALEYQQGLPKISNPILLVRNVCIH